MRLTWHLGSTLSNARIVGFITLALIGAAFVLSAAVQSDRLRRYFAGSAMARSAKSRGERPPAGDRMLFIDGLRGIACLAVLIFHLTLPGLTTVAEPIAELVPRTITELIRNGYLGVDMFFVLSGFVIAYSLRNHRITPSVAWRFAVRRSLRLDPPYHAMLLISLGILAFRLPNGLYDVGRKLLGAPGLLANATYLHDLLGYPTLLGVAWTLCLEIQFYLAFVILAATARVLAERLLRALKLNEELAHELALMIIFLPLAVTSFAAWYPQLKNLTFLGTWFQFFLGVVVFWATRSSRMGILAWGFIGCVSALSIAMRDLRGGAAAATGVLILVVNHRGRLTTWLKGATWQYFGRTSYSLYLVHVAAMPLMNWLWSISPQTGMMAFSVLAIGVGASIAAAHLLHALFERPSLALSRMIHY